MTSLPEPHVLLIDLRDLDFLAVAGARALLDVAGLCLARSVECSVVAGVHHPACCVLERLDATNALHVIDEPDHVRDPRES